jgi:hypothetical protein
MIAEAVYASEILLRVIDECRYRLQTVSPLLKEESQNLEESTRKATMMPSVEQRVMILMTSGMKFKKELIKQKRIDSGILDEEYDDDTEEQDEEPETDRDDPTAVDEHYY